MDRVEHKIDKQVDSEGEEQELRQMMKAMMGMMRDVSKDVKEVKGDLAVATGIAKQAKAAADTAVQTAEDAKAEVVHMKESMVTKAELPQMMKQIMQGEMTDTMPGPCEPPSMIFGGLSGATSVAEAEEWLNNILVTAGLPRIINPYIKSDDFENLMFAKYPTTKAAETAIEFIRRKAPTYKDNTVWCNIDRPANVRIPLKLLFRIKKLITKWGFNKRVIRIDEGDGTLQVGESLIVKMSAQDGNLIIEWLNEEWEHWKDLQESDEFQKLLQECRDDLALAHQRQSKGLGKGKPTAA